MVDVVVAIEMAVSTIFVLAFEEGGNVMLWQASAMVRIVLFSRNNNNERKDCLQSLKAKTLDSSRVWLTVSF